MGTISYRGEIGQVGLKSTHTSRAILLACESPKETGRDGLKKTRNAL